MASLIQPRAQRKEIVPWYDSATAIALSIMGLIIVLAFGLMGLHVALTTAQYNNLWGLPLALVLMSGGVILAMVVRLLIRTLRHPR